MAQILQSSNFMSLHPLSHTQTCTQMASAAPTQNPKRLRFLENAIKNKHSFIQFFAMTGILLFSCRSLGQKYRLHDLREDTLALMEEQQALTERYNTIKTALLHEASVEPTSRFASRLRHLFNEQD